MICINPATLTPLLKSAVQSVNGQPGPDPVLTPADIGAAVPANVLPNVLEAGLPGIRSREREQLDLLYVDLSAPQSDANTPMFFGSDSPSADLVNAPYTAGPFYGLRLVLVSKSPNQTTHLVTVLIFETYPLPGRVWGNTYDIGIQNWYGWHGSNVI